MKPSIAKYYKAKIDPDLEDLLLEIIDSSDEKIDIKSLIVYFRKEMKVIEQISNLIFINSKSIKYPSDDEFKINTEYAKFNQYFYSQKFTVKQDFETKVSVLILKLKFLSKHDPQYILDQYNILKKFLINNGIEEDRYTY